MSQYDFCRDVWTSVELSCIIIICQTKTLYTWSLRLALFSGKIEHERPRLVGRGMYKGKFAQIERFFKYRPQAHKDSQPT